MDSVAILRASARTMAQATDLEERFCKTFIGAIANLRPEGRLNYYAAIEDANRASVSFPHKGGTQTICLAKNRRDQAAITVGEALLIIRESMTQSRQVPRDAEVISLRELPTAIERALLRQPAVPVATPQSPQRRRWSPLRKR